MATREYLKKAVQRSAEVDASVRSTVTEILGAVQNEGEVAVRRYSERLDRWSPPSFRLTPADINAGLANVSKEDRDQIAYCRDQVAALVERQRDTLSAMEVELQPGVVLGQKLIPVSSVGAYVPGGRYPLVASALMSITTAKVAGVSRIVACSPPAPGGGGIYPATLFAMVLCAAAEIYCRGGAQALADT